MGERSFLAWPLSQSAEVSLEREEGEGTGRAEVETQSENSALQLTPLPLSHSVAFWEWKGLGLNTRTCTLQTQQELGRPHPTPKVTSADKVRNVHRRTETAAAQKSQATWQKAACREAPPTQTQVILPSFLTIL